MLLAIQVSESAVVYVERYGLIIQVVNVRAVNIS